MNIGIDMMGGDYAPLEAVIGLNLFLPEWKTPVKLFLFGEESAVSSLIGNQLPADLYSIVHAPQVIGMHEHPTKALKEKQQSSIAIGFQWLASNRIDAFI